MDQLKNQIESLRRELSQKETKLQNTQERFSRVGVSLDQFSQLDEILKPLSEAEPQLITYVEKLDEKQVVTFLNFAELGEMIPFAMENCITGGTLIGYENTDLKSFPLKTRKKFLYKRSMLEEGKFRDEKHQKICGVCRASSVVLTIKLIQEYQIPLNVEKIRELELVGPELMFLSKGEVKKSLGVPLNKNREVVNKLKGLKKIHRNLLDEE